MTHKERKCECVKLWDPHQIQRGTQIPPQAGTHTGHWVHELVDIVKGKRTSAIHKRLCRFHNRFYSFFPCPSSQQLRNTVVCSGLTQTNSYYCLLWLPEEEAQRQGEWESWRERVSAGIGCVFDEITSLAKIAESDCLSVVRKVPESVRNRSQNKGKSK